MAITIRQAQVYGISVQRYSSGGSYNFNAAYGMHFASADPVDYELFADLNASGIYDANQNPSELVQANAITSGFKMVSLCATPSGSATQQCGLTSLDILFKRPEPDACISVNGISAMGMNSLGNEVCNDQYQQATIELQAPQGDVINVTVDSNGQIAVQ